MTNEDFKRRVIEKFQNQDLDLSKTLFVDSNTDVEIICRKHGLFRVRPYTILGVEGCGCKECSKEEHRKQREEKFKKKVMERFPDQDLDLSGVRYENDETEVKIVCRKHGPFKIKPKNLFGQYGCGCRECSKEAIRKEKEDNFIRQVKEKFGDKYSFELLHFIAKKKPVKLICHTIGRDGKEHGVFEVTPLVLLRESTIYGCQKCKIDSRAKTTDEFVKQVREKYPNADWDLSRARYDNCDTKVEIVCHEKDENGIEHGSFWITPYVLLADRTVYGCTKCWLANRCKTKEEFIKEFRLKYPKRKISFEKFEYITYNTKSIATCHVIGKNGREHGDFPITPTNLLMGHGCPKCVQSHAEEEIAMLLDGFNINYQQEQKFIWLGQQELDFYLLDYNLAIEYQGGQHFFPVDFAGRGQEWAEEHFEKVIERDQRKARLCEENGVRLFYIRYDEDVEERLKDILTEIGAINP